MAYLDDETADDRPIPADLMSKPALSWAEFWQLLLGIPESTAEQVVREEPAPKFFLIGRRRYIRREDAEAWLRDRAIAMPYYPRRNRRAS